MHKRDVSFLSTTIAILFASCFAFANSPIFTTFQTKIVSPAGTELESASVNFRFTILDSAGTCVLYIEDFNTINMTGSKGIVSFPLGSGTKVYPPAATSLYKVFDNSTASFNCQAGGTYAPTSADNRQIVMQFNDGSGWQTLPQMAINGVPYANYATRAESLGDYAAGAYLRPATLPTCTAGQAINWDGTTFTCMTPAGGAGGVASVTATAPVVVSGGTSTPVVSMPKATASANGYLSSADWTTFNNKANAVVGAGKIYLGNASGDATGVTVSGDATLASSGVLTLANSGVSAGTYGSGTRIPVMTVDAKGRLTGVTTTPVTISSSDVTTALGYTPSNSTNSFTRGGNAFGADSYLGLIDGNNLSIGTTGSNLLYLSGTSTQPTATFYGASGTRSTLVVSQTQNNTSGSVESVVINTNANPGASSTGSYSGLSITNQYQAISNATTGSLIGASITTNATTNSNIGKNIGVKSSVGMSGGTNPTTAEAIAFNAQLTNSAATMTNAYGLKVENTSNTSGGVITNSYGAYVGTLAGTNKWSFYAADTSAPSYFGGNVGLGTTTPQYGLDAHTFVVPLGLRRTSARFVDTSGPAANSGAGIGLGGQYDLSGSIQEYAGIQGQKENSTVGNSAGYLAFSTSANGAPRSEKMRIASDGKVGIGTTTPSAMLAVAGDVNITGNYYVNGVAIGGGSSGPTLSGITTINNSSGDITLGPAAGTGAVQINSGTASTSPTTGALVVSGGIGASGGIYSGGAISSGSTVSATTSMYSPQLYGTSSPSGNIRIDGTSDATKGNVLLASGGGNVGIGTTTPSAKLDLQDSITSSSAGNYTSINQTTNVSPGAAATTANYIGQKSSTSYNASSFGLGSITGSQIVASYTNPQVTGGINSVIGQLVSTQVSTGGTGGTSYGVKSTTSLSGGGNGSIYGVDGAASVSGSLTTATTVMGGNFSAATSSTGAVGTAYGVNSNTSAAAGSSISNAYGIYSSVTGSGTISNGYGLYVGTVKGTNKYSLYASDATAPSYFAGSIGIGTTSPAYALSVSGDVNVTGNFRVNGVVLSGGGGGATQTGVTSISNASGDITLAPAVGTGAVQINSGSASTSPTTGALVVSGGIGVSGGIYTGGAISSGSTISANTSMFTPQLYGTSTPAGDISIDGTSHATKGNVLLASTGGKVGIGTTSPSSPLHIMSTSSIATAAGEAGLLVEKNWSVADSNTKFAGRFISNSYNAGTLSSTVGVGSDVDHANGTLLNAFNFYANSNIAAGSSVFNRYGVNITDANGTGSISNQYGIYIGSLDRGTNNYAIFTAGTTTPSSFGGSVGIGTTTPTEKLSVAGNINVGTQVSRSVASTERGQLASGSTLLQTTNSSTTVDWNNGNMQEIATFVCDGAKTITFNNVKDGGVYSLLISGAGAHSGTCVFSAAGRTFIISGGAAAPTASASVMFTFAVFGTKIVYSMTDNLL